MPTRNKLELKFEHRLDIELALIQMTLVRGAVEKQANLNAGGRAQKRLIEDVCCAMEMLQLSVNSEKGKGKV